MKNQLIKTTSLTLLIAVTLLTACGKENKGPAGEVPTSPAGNPATPEGIGGKNDPAKESTNPGPGGTWAAERKEPDETRKVRLIFYAKRVVVESQCIFADGQVIPVTIQSPVTYGEGNFKIESRVREVKLDKGRKCDISLDAGEYPYTITGNQMSILPKGEKTPVVLTKE